MPKFPDVSAVAPHAGAWIEIKTLIHNEQPDVVAPHAGAWIEMGAMAAFLPGIYVAPHAGAWIEILTRRRIVRHGGRPPRGGVD